MFRCTGYNISKVLLNLKSLKYLSTRSIIQILSNMQLMIFTIRTSTAFNVKYRTLFALKMHNGNMDQELKIIPWKLDVMRLTLQSYYSRIRTPPSTNFVHTILLKKRHENLFLKIHSQ